MVSGEELAALRSEHGNVCVLRDRKKQTLAVFRPATKTIVAPHFAKSAGDAEAAIVEACLLAPSLAEYRKMRAKIGTLNTWAFIAIKGASGGQCSVDLDEEAGTVEAYTVRKTADGEEDAEAPREVVYKAGALGYYQYRRYQDSVKSGKLEASVLACVEAGTFPEKRDDRFALFEKLPYLAASLIDLVLFVSSGGIEIEGN